MGITIGSDPIFHEKGSLAAPDESGDKIIATREWVDARPGGGGGSSYLPLELTGNEVVDMGDYSLSFNDGADKYLSLNKLIGEYFIGDDGAIGNNTELYLNDATGAISLTTGFGAGRSGMNLNGNYGELKFDIHDYTVLDLDWGGDTYSVGDLNNKLNGTRLQIRDADSAFNLNNVTEYADNAAALIAGLQAGDIYRTADVLKIVH